MCSWSVPHADMQLLGWALIGGRLTSNQTPAGLIARGGEMKGRCHTGECRRSVTLDAQDWIARGYANTSLAERCCQANAMGLRLGFVRDETPLGSGYA
jgi:hypothetical protein